MAILTGTQVLGCFGMVCVTACVMTWLIVDYLDNKSKREAKIQMQENKDDKNR